MVIGQGPIWGGGYGIPFDAINAAARAQLPSLLRAWFPNGKAVGHEWHVGSINGEAGDSFRVNMLTGKFAEFNGRGESGGDVIGLYAAKFCHGDRVQAALELADEFGIEIKQRARGEPKPKAKPDDGQPQWSSLIPPPVDAGRPSAAMLSGFDMVHWYTSLDKRETHVVGRIEARGGKPKLFIPTTYGELDGVLGWHKKAPNPPRPLYGLNRLTTMPDASVILCEGEKAADAAQRLFTGHVCLSWFGGAAQLEHADLGPLANRTVIVWPDADAPGLDAMRKLLPRLPADTQVVRVDDLPDGFDADDLERQGCEDPAAWLNERLQPNEPPAKPEPKLAAERNGCEQCNSEWPNPQPLPDSLLPVAAFDYELVPDEMRAWIKDVSERMQCPPDFVAVSSMTALGAVIGRRLAIRPKAKDDWTVTANMWGLIIGRPGVLKSPSMNDALRPMHWLSALAEANFKKEIAEYDLTASANKLRRDANAKEAAEKLKKDRTADVRSLLKEDQASEPPTLKRYIANDTNVASLGALLQQNPNGLLVFRDEILSLLDTLDREEFVSERGFYLTGWNGDSSYTFDRIGRGLHLHIDGVCLSMLGSAQPGRISQYLGRAIRGGRFDDGLIQRFGLMVWPDISDEWKHVDRAPDQEAKAEVMRLFERLDALDLRAIGACNWKGDEEGLPYLRFDDGAYELYKDWHAKLEHRLHGGDELHPALESHLAKYRKLIPGLSLICHVADLADGSKGPVGTDGVRRGIAWAPYLESHAQRAYGSVTAASADTAKVILAKIRSGHLKDKFRSRDVWRPNWSRLTDRDAVHAGLTMLVDYDWLAQRTVDTNGRPATVYTVNPKALAPA